MNERERLLALDAACCAAELCRDDGVREAISLLNDELDRHFGADIPFGHFLKEQHKAVKMLADNPQVFGGDPVSY